MPFRLYQQAAIDSVTAYFKKNSGNPIIAMPTGTGKSWVIGGLIQLAMSFKNQRVLVLTHVKELIEQNYQTALKICPELDAGIYSAGLGRRDTNNPVLFAGIASVYKKKAKFDLVLIDECHLVSTNEKTMYRSFLKTLKEFNPLTKVIGFSATPYRMKTGRLADGKLFTDVCFDQTGVKAFNRLIDSGYLAPLIAREPSTEFDLTSVHVRGGEFIPSELQHAVDQQAITEQAVKELVAVGVDRKKWLIFATGIDHCGHVVESLKSHGILATEIHSKITAEERAERLHGFKTGVYTAIVNNNVLTTGFDCPEIDLIGMLRPTMSPGLWVQMLGRGTRPSEGKENCLVLDFAGNTKRLGPINDVAIPKGIRGGKRKGQAPVRVCPDCKTINHASVTQCVLCGYKFPKQTKLCSTAAGLDVLASGEPRIQRLTVDSVRYNKHNKKGKIPSLKVTYQCGLTFYKEWVCLEHTGYANVKACAWWSKRIDGTIPNTVDDALKLVDKLNTPKKIDVNLASKFAAIIDYVF